MPTNTKTASFMNPADQAQALIEQQQLARRQALVDALRQQSTEDIPSNGGRISWMQGMAKMLQAGVARNEQKKIDTQQTALAVRSYNSNAALHDPTGKAIPQISLGTEGKSNTQNLARALKASSPGPASADPTQPPPIAAPQPQPSPSSSPSPASPQDGSPASTPGSLWSPADRSANVAKLTGQPQPGSSGQVPFRMPGDPAPVQLDASDFGPNSDGTNLGVPPVPGRAAATPPAGGRALAKGLQDYGDARKRRAQAFAAALGPSIGADPSSVPAGGSAGQPVAPSAPLAPPQPNASTQNPADPQPQSDAPVMDALVPTMTARDAFYLQANAPDEYWKAVAAAGTPTDVQRAIRAAGIDPHGPEGQQMLHEGARKAALTPVGDDKRGYLYDPYTGKTVGYHPQLETGQQPVADSQGDVTGAATLPGFASSTQEIETAKARGRAAGDVVTGYDPVTHQPTLVAKSDVLAGNGGKPFYTGAPLGAGAGADQAFKDSQKGFADDAAAGAGAPQRKFLLSQIRDLAKVTTTGQGAPEIAGMKSRINTALASAGMKPWFDNNGIANVQEIQKNAANLAQQQAAAYGGANGSTDAKLAAAFAALPDANKAPQAIQTIVGILSAGEDATVARQQASAAYNRAHTNDPNGHANFLSEWTKNADPELFQRIAAARGNPKALTQGLTPKQADEMLVKYRAIKNMGGF